MTLGDELLKSLAEAVAHAEGRGGGIVHVPLDLLRGPWTPYFNSLDYTRLETVCQVVHLMSADSEGLMELAVTDAKARLTDLVRRAEAGEEVVLTRHGHAVARIVALKVRPRGEHRAELIASIRSRAAAKALAGPAAARSQDFLYDDDGLPK